MSDPAKEPDETPVERRHVLAFLEWYRARVAFPDYQGLEDHWVNALQTLTLGELRRGIKAAAAYRPFAYLEPPRFWHVCRGTRSFESALKTQRLRHSLGRKKE